MGELIASAGLLAIGLSALLRLAKRDPRRSAVVHLGMLQVVTLVNGATLAGMLRLVRSDLGVVPCVAVSLTAVMLQWLGLSLFGRRAQPKRPVM